MTDTDRFGIRLPIGTLAFEILPRIYGQFLAFLFYRWEIIMRETAIVGAINSPSPATKLLAAVW